MNIKTATPSIAIALSFTFLSVGCDYTGDWLFAGAVEGLPSVLDLGRLEVMPLKDASSLAAAITYHEVGPTGTPVTGGVTFTFEGTGSDVCVWVDPEAAYWIQSLSPIYGVPDLNYPDNIFDDGDLDLKAGLAVFYSGSPGEEMGTFAIRYEDSLGNVVPIDANECTIPSEGESSGGHSGRGTAEACTLQTTQPGVSYLVAMETYATPIDDDRLAFGLMLTHGDCGDVQSTVGAVHNECVIRNESGQFDDNGVLVPYQNAAAFESAFCNSAGEVAFELRNYCEDEAEEYNDLLEQGIELDHLFCGDPSISPFPGL
jgi:hypothetical protein